MKAEAKFDGTQLVTTLTAENEGEKVILHLVDGATPKFTVTSVTGETAGISVMGSIELDKSKRSTTVNIQP